MPVPAPKGSHDQKVYVAPNFNHLDLRNAVVPLTTLLASHKVDTGVSEQKCHVAPPIDNLDLRNAMVPLMTPLASCDPDANANGIKLPMSLVTLHFNCAMVPLTN